MKVKELLLELYEFDFNLPIIMSKDAEGNKYNSLVELYEGYYLPDNTWSGEFYTKESLTEWGINEKDCIKAVALYPQIIRNTINGIKVKELIKKLKTLDEDLEVIMSEDSEGNGFSPFRKAFDVYYQYDTTWGGDIYDDEELKEEGLTKTKLVQTIVFFPVN